MVAAVAAVATAVSVTGDSVGGHVFSVGRVVGRGRRQARLGAGLVGLDHGGRGSPTCRPRNARASGGRQ